MTPEDSLKKYGTTALSIDVMGELIHVDRAGGRVDFARWVAAVPITYREQVVEACKPVVTAFQGRQLTEATLTDLLHRLHTAVCRLPPRRARTITRPGYLITDREPDPEEDLTKIDLESPATEEAFDQVPLPPMSGYSATRPPVHDSPCSLELLPTTLGWRFTRR